jgi:transposase InsO family protein
LGSTPASNPGVTSRCQQWEIEFAGPINPPMRRSEARYIITTKKYLTTWEEETPVKDCSAETTTHFLFEKVITIFGCPIILMSDQGTHFIKSTIGATTEEFEVYHQKSTPYHPQENRTIESFNKISENALTKLFQQSYGHTGLHVRSLQYIHHSYWCMGRKH